MGQFIRAVSVFFPFLPSKSIIESTRKLEALKKEIGSLFDQRS
jgi:hypothetical protein